jgi:prepilin-type N-terminal cleavage/methylation domain-containing protein
MKNAYKQKREAGFTIIEVLIVLAIAALILLIVFLAVPALQRNARNTQRKSDAANIGSAISNFEGNNSGALPTAYGYSDQDQVTMLLHCMGGNPSVTGTYTAGHDLGTINKFGCLNSNNNFDSAKLGYYKPADQKVFFNNAALGALAPAAPGSESNTNISTNSLIINLGYTCNSSNTGVGSASSRSVAILYVAESSTGDGNLQCVQS